MTTTEAPTARLMTASELMALPSDGYHCYELDRGRLVGMAPAADEPGRVGGRVLAALVMHVVPLRLGDVGSGETGFRLFADPDTVRVPDAWFVRAERVPPPAARRRSFEGAPDLTVEVVSPSDDYRDVLAKAREYMTAGATLYWGIDPAARTALVFNANGTYAFLDDTGSLDGGALLPGLSIPLKELFD